MMCKSHRCDNCRIRKRAQLRRAREARRIEAPRKTYSPEHDRPYLVEDLERLLGTDSPQNVAHRLGYLRPESLTRRLYRMGRDDLARVFQRTEAAA